METVKSLARIMLLFVFGMCLYSCIGPVPVEVVMINNELLFMLEEEHEISDVWVSVLNPNAGEKPRPLWGIGHNLTTDVQKRKYPRLKQIKYGQKFEEFPVVEGPAQLQRNVEYFVKINMGNKFAIAVFIITNDNKVIMPYKKLKVKVENSGQNMLVSNEALPIHYDSRLL
jgi:hypothetical protein